MLFVQYPVRAVPQDFPYREQRNIPYCTHALGSLLREVHVVKACAIINGLAEEIQVRQSIAHTVIRGRVRGHHLAIIDRHFDAVGDNSIHRQAQ